MFVSGFTFIRNAVKYDYPVKESIESVLPLCDEFVVVLGQSEDETEALIKNIDSSKIRIVKSIWDDSLREGGRVLAAETDKGLDAISEHSDWVIYIQADEVLHEQYHAALRESMFQWVGDQRVEGLLLAYTHFYGSYDYVGDSRRWYRNEIRVVRNDRRIRSFRDAQGFRKDGRLMRVKRSGACMYHYGWVKPPEKQQAKQAYFHKLWHDDHWVSKHIPQQEGFDYSKIDSLKLFQGTHPKVMQERIRQKNWTFSFDPTQKNFGFKNRFLYFIERVTGWRIGEYRNYREVR